MGNVTYHEELIGTTRERDKTIGGGLWYWNEKNDVVYFWGSSLDFGSVFKEDFEKALENSLISPFMEDSKFLFSNYCGIVDTNKMENYINLFEEIKKPE